MVWSKLFYGQSQMSSQHHQTDRNPIINGRAERTQSMVTLYIYVAEPVFISGDGLRATSGVVADIEWPRLRHA